LRFLCLWLVVLMPFQVIVQIYFTIRYVTDAESLSTAALGLIVAQYSLMTLIAVYGAVVGLHMWKKRPFALKRARRFLIIRLGLRTISIFAAWALIQAPLTPAPSILLSGIAMAIAHFGITWLYLSSSKRVANTFPETTG